MEMLVSTWVEPYLNINILVTGRFELIDGLFSLLGKHAKEFCCLEDIEGVETLHESQNNNANIYICVRVRSRRSLVERCFVDGWKVLKNV